MWVITLERVIQSPLYVFDEQIISKVQSGAKSPVCCLTLIDNVTYLDNDLYCRDQYPGSLYNAGPWGSMLDQNSGIEYCVF